MQGGDDLHAALTPIVAAFDRLGVEYLVGDSVASSAHGEFRATNDIDLLAAMDPADVRPFVEALGDAYYHSEDVVLAKLAWFRAGDESSERQWRDVLGVVRVQAERLDIAYLRRWAPELGIDDLVERALNAGRPRDDAE